VKLHGCMIPSSILSSDLQPNWMSPMFVSTPRRKSRVSGKPHLRYISRRWFQIFFIFTPILREMIPNLTFAYFSKMSWVSNHQLAHLTCIFVGPVSKTVRNVHSASALGITRKRSWICKAFGGKGLAKGRSLWNSDHWNWAHLWLALFP